MLRLIERPDRGLADTFDDLRRSTALRQLAWLQSHDLRSQVRLLAWVVSSKSWAKRCLSWPTLSRCKAATSLTMFNSTGFSFFGRANRSTRVDSEPQFVAKCKAIRDKKERFLSREKCRDEAGFL